MGETVSDLVDTDQVSAAQRSAAEAGLADQSTVVVAGLEQGFFVKRAGLGKKASKGFASAPGNKTERC